MSQEFTIVLAREELLLIAGVIGSLNRTRALEIINSGGFRQTLRDSNSSDQDVIVVKDFIENRDGIWSLYDAFTRALATASRSDDLSCQASKPTG